MNTKEKLSAIRAEMKAVGADYLIVVSDDFHQSEYVGDYFKARAYLSGFTGSAGTLIVSANDAKLFTDGRYYLQAEKQLADSGIDLMRMGSEGVPTPTEYIISKAKSGETVAYDGRCVSVKTTEELTGKLKKDVRLLTDTDLVNRIWKDRPTMPDSTVYSLDLKFAGKSHADKLTDVRDEIRKADCDALVLSSLCDIAWLYNLRGHDVESCQVFLSYVIITADRDILYCGKSAAESAKLLLNDAEIRPYGQFYDDLRQIRTILSDSGKKPRIFLDKSAVNTAILSCLSDCDIHNAANPTALMKAVKNETELKNLRLCHIADGLAVTKFMLMLKYDKPSLTECSAAELLWAFRKEAADRLGVTLMMPSFETIAAFGANAAIVHYTPSADSNAVIDDSAVVPMLLVDSGGHYLEGTTDITRTLVLGNIPEEVKKHYTLTTAATLRLAGMTFLEGATGASLDVICRQPLWENALDFRHGTGHGVGYLLSVHEGPNRFHWKSGHHKLAVGMVTSDEPGIYIEGSHGIRIENEIAVVPAVHNEYGQFLRFDNLTYCPIDLDGIDLAYLDKSDIRRLNEYHKTVYETLSPYVCSHDREKMAYMTRAIGNHE